MTCLRSHSLFISKQKLASGSPDLESNVMITYHISACKTQCLSLGNKKNNDKNRKQNTERQGLVCLSLYPGYHKIMHLLALSKSLSICNRLQLNKYLLSDLQLIRQYMGHFYIITFILYYSIIITIVVYYQVDNS